MAEYEPAATICQVSIGQIVQRAQPDSVLASVRICLSLSSVTPIPRPLTTAHPSGAGRLTTTRRTMLFSTSSLLTMLHGLVLSGGALMLLVLALLSLRLTAASSDATGADRHAAMFGRLAVAAAILLWLSVVSGTYFIFPMYRATPPEGVTALADYPRALLMSKPDTRWLHSFGMEIKEHVPWIAAMLATAAAFVALRHPASIAADRTVRRATGALLVIALMLTASVALLGVFVNKVAPVW